jgi:hypothetical protein
MMPAQLVPAAVAMLTNTLSQAYYLCDQLILCEAREIIIHAGAFST